MSLQDELRAQKLAFSKDTDSLATIESKDLSEVRSQAGCNMLFVYLLNRWGSCFEAGAMTKLGEDREIHDLVIKAYLKAGCQADEQVAASKLFSHTPPAFRHMVRLKGKLSPLDFAQRMLQEVQQDMVPDAHAQLEGVCALLGGEPAQTSMPEPAPTGLDVAHGFLLQGRRMNCAASALADIRAGAQSQGLSVFVAGDELEQSGDVEIIIGHELASSNANEGQPIELQDIQADSEGDIWLLASGPLSSASLVQGSLGTSVEPGAGKFFCGSDMGQNAHHRGVWGRLVLSADSTATKCTESLTGGLFLIVRYD